MQLRSPFSVYICIYYIYIYISQFHWLFPRTHRCRHVFRHHLIGILIVTNAAIWPAISSDKCIRRDPLMSFYLTLISNNIIIYRYIEGLGLILMPDTYAGIDLNFVVQISRAHRGRPPKKPRIGTPAIDATFLESGLQPAPLEGQYMRSGGPFKMPHDHVDISPGRGRESSPKKHRDSPLWILL